MMFRGCAFACRQFAAVLFGLLYAALAVAQQNEIKPPLWKSRGPLPEFKVEQDFSLSIYAQGLKGPRSLALGEKGTLFVGSTTGQIYAILNRNGDTLPDRIVVVNAGLKAPVAVAIRGDRLFAAYDGNLLYFNEIERRCEHNPQGFLAYENLPSTALESERSIAVGADGAVYIGIPAPCNVCRPKNPMHATVLRVSPDLRVAAPYSRGLRYPAAMTFDDQQRLWLADWSRSWMMDTSLGDEINRIDGPGLHLGFPACHGSSISDPDYGHANSCDTSQSPVWLMPPRSHPSGLAYIGPNSGWPQAYQNSLVVAENGTMFRNDTTGFRLGLLLLDKDGKPTEYRPLVQGWMGPGENPLGCPTGVLLAPTGELYIADECKGRIWCLKPKGWLRNLPAQDVFED